MLHRLMLKVTKFQLPTPKRLGTVGRNILGAIVAPCQIGLRAFIGVETAALSFRTKQYSTSCSSHICYGKRFYNDFIFNHKTKAFVHNCFKLLSCVVIETVLDGMKKNHLSQHSLLLTRKRTI